MPNLGKRSASENGRALQILNYAHFNQAPFLAWLGTRDIPTYGDWNVLQRFFSEWSTARAASVPSEGDLRYLESATKDPSFWTQLKSAAALARKQQEASATPRPEQRVQQLTRAQYTSVFADAVSAFGKLSQLTGTEFKQPAPSSMLEPRQYYNAAVKLAQDATAFVDTNPTGNTRLDDSIAAQARVLTGLVSMMSDVYQFDKRTNGGTRRMVTVKRTERGTPATPSPSLPSPMSPTPMEMSTGGADEIVTMSTGHDAAAADAYVPAVDAGSDSDEGVFEWGE